MELMKLTRHKKLGTQRICKALLQVTKSTIGWWGEQAPLL